MKPRIRVRPLNNNCHTFVHTAGTCAPVVIHKSEVLELTNDNSIVDWLRNTYDRQVRNNCNLLAEATASVLRLS